MKAVARVGYRELGVAAVDIETGKFCAVAEIFAVRPAINAIAIGPAEPWNANPIASCKSIYAFADLLDAADNLVTKNERKFRIGQLAINDMKIGAANGAGVNPNEQLSMARFGFGQVAEREWLSNFFEHHRAHGDVSSLARAGGSWLEFAFLAGDRFAFVMSMRAAQERNSIEDVLLEPFEP